MEIVDSPLRKHPEIKEVEYEVEEMKGGEGRGSGTDIYALPKRGPLTEWSPLRQRLTAQVARNQTSGRETRALLRDHETSIRIFFDPIVLSHV